MVGNCQKLKCENVFHVGTETNRWNARAIVVRPNKPLNIFWNGPMELWNGREAYTELAASTVQFYFV